MRGISIDAEHMTITRHTDGRNVYSTATNDRSFFLRRPRVHVYFWEDAFATTYVDEAVKLVDASPEVEGVTFTREIFNLTPEDRPLNAMMRMTVYHVPR
jgi:hypothetical protein